jgi:hypothetical protein
VLYADFLLDIPFILEDEGNKLLQNVGNPAIDCTVIHLII